MSAVDVIRQAEREADETLQRATDEAERMRTDAAAQAAEALDAAIQASRDAAQREVDHAKREAQAYLNQARRVLDGELAALAAREGERRSAAITRVLKLIGVDGDETSD